MSAEEITNKTYDLIAVDYAERYWNMSLHDMLQRFTNLVQAGGQVLDLGCGPGRDVALLNERGFNTIGIDRSLGMLQQAKQRVGLQFACADMRQLPLAEASLDGIWMCASLLHIPHADVPHVLNEAYRVLRTKGVLYISVRQGVGEEWSNSDGGPRFFTLFQLEALFAFVKEAQFKVQWHSLESFGHSTWINVLCVVENK